LVDPWWPAGASRFISTPILLSASRYHHRRREARRRECPARAVPLRASDCICCNVFPQEFARVHRRTRPCPGSCQSAIDARNPGMRRGLRRLFHILSQFLLLLRAFRQGRPAGLCLKRRRSRWPASACVALGAEPARASSRRAALAAGESSRRHIQGTARTA